jgi:oxygen-independent coproporphyrinogen-3 oxidase
VNADIFGRYAERPLPRYTSYPTAPHFKQPAEDASYRAQLASLPAGEKLSLYIHVPFCRSMCWYCGCHTSVTGRDAPIDRYMGALAGELEMVADAMKQRLALQHVHFGGGTPTLMGAAHFLDLMGKIRSRFAFADDAELAIEIDPRTLSLDMVEALGQGGITRASIGVQSFDPAVQRAINRVQSEAQTAQAVRQLREAGIGRINFDLIYGLPHQDIASCLDTVERAVALAPDRLAVFGYAHVPAFKRHQRKIQDAALPGARERRAQAEAIAEALRCAGYVQIGLDHFARPDDALAIAARGGRLHRNFQGYTTDPCQTLIGLGASSIGRLPTGYVQNILLSGEYQRRIAEGLLPVAKGCELSADDRLRAAVIERIMCDYEVDLDQVCSTFGADAGKLISSASALDDLIADGIARRDHHRIMVPPDARPLVRVLAAAFDQYLGQGEARHSRAV